MNVKYKNTSNPHLKLVNEADDVMLKKIIEDILQCSKKEMISVLNIGGGFSKASEIFLSNHKNISYFVLDIQNSENKKVILGDITDENLELGQTFDFIYTADTFEHILNPWDATKNIKKLLNNNGYIFCKVPFAWRYHACPFDTYRYSHTGIRYLFEYLSQIKHVFSGYKKEQPNSGWYVDKTDVTLNGNNFTECIETYYIGQKDINHIFNTSDYDKGWKRN